MIVNNSNAVFLLLRKSICLFLFFGFLCSQGKAQTTIISADSLSEKPDTLAHSSNKIDSTSIYKCEIQAIHNKELKIDYAILEDSSVTFCISHSLSGDSLLFQSYSLEKISCINHSTADTAHSYESNMTLKQHKRVYAGAKSFYFVRIPIAASPDDTLELKQDFNEGPLQFPSFCLNTFHTQDTLPSTPYLSETLTGTIAFYTRQRLGKLDVYIDGGFIGTIQQAIPKKSDSPDCGDISAQLVNARVSSGLHHYTVKSSKIVWEGEFQMLRESCIRINIEK